MTRCLLAITLGLTLLGAGCQSAGGRARQHAEVFDALPTADQQRLLAGKVTIGDSPEMVKIALGRPDRDNAITVSNGGTRRTWAYWDKRYVKERSRISYTEGRSGAVVEDIYRVLHVLEVEVVFMNERVVHVRDPQREAQALAALK